MSDYETQRNKRIAANRDMLAALGLGAAKEALESACRSDKPAAKPRAPKAEALPSRRSDRAANLPKVDYKQETLEGEVRSLMNKGKQRSRSRLFDVQDSSDPGCAYVKIMLDSLISGGYWAQAPFGLGQWLPNRDSLAKAGIVTGPKETPKATIVLECAGEEWDVVWMNRSKSGDGGGFSGGWRGFAIDQRLAPGDAVVFKKEFGLTLRVSIFRSWLHKNARDAADSAFDHADAVMKAMLAGDGVPTVSSCSTDPSIHCHSRKAAGWDDPAARANDKIRAGATADRCLELARAEHSSLVYEDGDAVSAPAVLTHTKAAKVSREVIEQAESWPVWTEAPSDHGPKSVETHHSFGFEEKILLLTGRAVVTPQNSSDPPITAGPGDLLCFGKGLRCKWEISEPLDARYIYLNEKGNPIEEERIDCDRCGQDCWERSWLLGELDVCPKCYDAQADDDAVYQEYGQPATSHEAAGTPSASDPAPAQPSKRNNDDSSEEPAHKKPKHETPQAQPESAIRSQSLPRKAPAEVEKQAEKSSTRQKAELDVGTKVWAKLAGWPAWPAKVSSAEAEQLDEEPPEPDQLLVVFYGEGSYEWLAPSKLKKLDNAVERLAKLSQKKEPALYQALKEALADQNNENHNEDEDEDEDANEDAGLDEDYEDSE